MKKLNKLCACLLCAVLAFAVAGCNSDEEQNNDMYNGTINIFVPFDTYATNALTYVKNAYRRLHPQTTINITNGGDSYEQAVEGIILEIGRAHV